MRKWLSNWLASPELQQRILVALPRNGNEITETELKAYLDNPFRFHFAMAELVKAGRVRRARYCSTVYYQKV
jgi:hypothetical protein